ncbi:hypothetical protein MKX73_19520 [Solibacillus sp. FSL W7-1436]|uniref:hypothetical protein n=1 Tax=Solibacillus sp. FSL W7-1436 TaxID=2921705 RepID=UPI0030FA4032
MNQYEFKNITIKIHNGDNSKTALIVNKETSEQLNLLNANNFATLRTKLENYFSKENLLEVGETIDHIFK